VTQEFSSLSHNEWPYRTTKERWKWNQNPIVHPICIHQSSSVFGFVGFVVAINHVLLLCSRRLCFCGHLNDLKMFALSMCCSILPIQCRCDQVILCLFVILFLVKVPATARYVVIRRLWGRDCIFSFSHSVLIQSLFMLLLMLMLWSKIVSIHQCCASKHCFIKHWWNLSCSSYCGVESALWYCITSVPDSLLFPFPYI